MRTRITTVAAVAVTLMMGIVGVAGASAHEFKSSSKANVKLTSSGGKQTFVTAGGTVECETVTDTGTAKEKSETQLVLATYHKCNGFGTKVVIKLVGSAESTNGAVEYLFNANESVKIEKSIVIEGAEEGQKTCHVVVPGGQELKTIKYSNKEKGIEEKTELTKVIESEGLGGTETGCTYAKEKAGTYTGSSLSTSTEATLEWV